LKEVRPAIVLLLAFTVLTGLVYPLVMTGLANVIFPYQAHVSLIEKDGKVIGSELMRQNFTSDRYFRGRPSATVGPDPADPSKTVSVPYNAANSESRTDQQGAHRPHDRRFGEAEEGEPVDAGAYRFG
jgi:K+-transporting ATPase ATPase C chain